MLFRPSHSQGEMRSSSQPVFRFAVANEIYFLDCLKGESGHLIGAPIGLLSTHQSSANVHIGGVQAIDQVDRLFRVDAVIGGYLAVAGHPGRYGDSREKLQ